MVKKRILVVDDDQDISEPLAELLSAHYVVDIAANGAAAAELVCDNRYDAIVLDLMMPVMDGATFKQLLDRQRIAIPVLLMSASVELPERAVESSTSPTSSPSHSTSRCSSAGSPRCSANAQPERRCRAARTPDGPRARHHWRGPAGPLTRFSCGALRTTRRPRRNYHRVAVDRARPFGLLVGEVAAWTQARVRIAPAPDVDQELLRATAASPGRHDHPAASATFSLGETLRQPSMTSLGTASRSAG